MSNNKIFIGSIQKKVNNNTNKNIFCGAEYIKNGKTPKPLNGRENIYNGQIK